LIIKSIKLSNIRSYKEATIDLSQGTTLFEGAAGSGKSTILMGIEFALFGIASQTGDSLLRKRESEGFVSLIFEANGKEYTVRRTLERRKEAVLQGEGFVRGPDGVLTARPKEIKARILEILNFNEPANPRTESKIYRYAIFTPQEEMKAILSFDPDMRLQTLRKALGVEDYKVAKDNAVKLVSLINSRIKILETAARDVDEKRTIRKDTITEINGYEQDLKQKENDRFALQHTLTDLDNKLSSFRAEKEELVKLQAKIPELEKQLSPLQGGIQVIQTRSNEARNKLKDLDLEIKGNEAIKIPTDQNEEELRHALKLSETRHKDLEKVVVQIDSKLENYFEILNNGVCPTCYREVDPSDFENKIEFEQSKREAAAVVVDQSARDIETSKNIVDALVRYNGEQKRVALLQENAQTFRNTIESDDKRIFDIKNQIQSLNEELGPAREEIKKLETVSTKLSFLEKSQTETNSELMSVEQEISALITRIDLKNARRKELEVEIENKDAMLATSNDLKEYRIWLKGYFAETVANIERVVLTSFQQQFDQFFQRWFGILVEDATKLARIDETFTPLAKQDGDEQALKNLSGGERTSIALAYRLALNMTVRKASALLQSDLLILDEPTDGFSKELLVKVGDVLSELECPQVILVSHEKELESFANQVLHVSKFDGVSTVT